MPEFLGEKPGTENFLTERSRIGKLWDLKFQEFHFYQEFEQYFFEKIPGFFTCRKAGQGMGISQLFQL